MIINEPLDIDKLFGIDLTPTAGAICCGCFWLSDSTACLRLRRIRCVIEEELLDVLQVLFG